ncbi:hypothetical protein CF126_04310 [Aeromonas dhakensis]|uniref:hypothetical protein n=1 Tax=Aeromonas dhakensis TaxID=196024 RepID=UPI00111A0956|nr:hypothetical protein [Aeromonas dhakensis]TNI58519.1 hypothetical protein CF126_04310 [Aeromonas dhakensis]
MANLNTHINQFTSTKNFDFMQFNTDEVNQLLRDIFFSQDKAKEEGNYKAYAEFALKLLEAKDQIEINTKKLEILKLLEEKGLSEHYTLTDKQTGRAVRGKKGDSGNASNAEPMTIKYLTKEGEVKTVLLEKSTMQISEKNFKDNAELLNFWNYCKKIKDTQGHIVFNGKKEYIINKNILADISEGDLKEQFKPYYTAA